MSMDFHEAFTKSSEALKYYIRGWDYFFAEDYNASIQYLIEAIAIDSTFAMAKFYLAWSYIKEGDYANTVDWVKRANENIEDLPLLYQNWIRLWYANHVNRDYDEIRNYLNLLENSDMKSRLFWWDLGTFYYNLCLDYEKASECFDKILELNKEWNEPWNYKPYYEHGYRWKHSYHFIGEHSKENKLYETGLRFFPENYKIRYNQAVCALSRGNKVKARGYIKHFVSLCEKEGRNEIVIERMLGLIYEMAEIFDVAEQHYRNALKIDPENYVSIWRLADFLILNDIDVGEGMELNQKLLRNNPNNPYRIRTQGYAYLKQGDLEEALKTLKRSDSLFIHWFDIENYLFTQEVEQALANLK